MNVNKQDILIPSVIPEEVFKAEGKLSDFIEIASDPNILLTYETVLNIILRFIFIFRYPEIADSKNISLPDIEFLIGCVLKQREILYSGVKSIQIDDPELIHTFTFIRETRYQISMLVDIASSAALFMDIANRKKPDVTSSSMYLGLDLGTGSGLLLLAQYIQARRNSAKSIVNVGIEKDIMEKYPGTLHAGRIADILGYGMILPQDITSPQTYSPLSGEKISHISNETIPNEHMSMGGIGKGQRNPDPFFESFETLYQTIDSAGFQDTTFFPEKLGIHVDIGEFQHHPVLEGSNQFGIPALRGLQHELENNPGVNLSKPEGWTIYDNIKPTSITVNGVSSKLSQVGNALSMSGIVKHNPKLITRWITQARKDSPLL